VDCLFQRDAPIINLILMCDGIFRLNADRPLSYLFSPARALSLSLSKVQVTEDRELNKFEEGDFVEFSPQ
jgi:hypothetical protein